MITFRNLTKRYGDVLAVDDISFTVEAGSITGFLGPNGAGKSTAMRCLTGLAFPTEGEALINGRRYRDIPNPSAQVGVLLDASAQHPGRTGRETLRAAAIAMGNVLLPALAKRNLPGRVGLAVGTLSVVMALSSALAASASVPLAEYAGWQWSLAVWLLPATAALCVWLAIARRAGAERGRADQM